MKKKTKRAKQFIKKVIDINNWDTKNLSWRYCSVPKQKKPHGYTKWDPKLNWEKKVGDFLLCKFTQKRTSIRVYANDEVEAVFISGHELFHYLIGTGQLKSEFWKPIHFFANIFGLVMLMKFFKEVGAVEKCPNCGSTDVIVKFRIQPRFVVGGDLDNLKVLEMPTMEEYGIDSESFLVLCGNCETKIEMNKEQKNRINKLLSVYDFDLTE